MQSKKPASTTSNKTGTTLQKKEVQNSVSQTKKATTTAQISSKSTTKKNDQKEIIKLENLSLNDKKQEQNDSDSDSQKPSVSEPVKGSAIVRYNHYKTSFPTLDGVMKASDIDDEYCLSMVFVGNFQIRLLNKEKKFVEEKIDSGKGKLFLNLNEPEYTLIIEEDEEEENKREKKGYVADSSSNNAIGGQRKEGCSCLYGNPCADQYVCENWNNRFEVAKKNGWKGY